MRLLDLIDDILLIVQSYLNVEEILTLRIVRDVYGDYCTFATIDGLD